MTESEQRVALVTGGNTGIGAAIVRRFIKSGVSVAMGYFEDEVGAKALAQELSAGDGKCIAVHGDVCDPRSVSGMVHAARDSLGPVTILVNNAGVARHGPFLQISEDEWDWMFQTNVYGAFRCTREVVPDMVAARSGCVVFITSELALIGEPELAHYVAAKAALIGLTKSLARELGPAGIRVNAVAPGPTDTRILTDEERTPEFARRLPLGRLGRPDEVAATVAFLCSDEGSWYTGQVLSPNGGAVI